MIFNNNEIIHTNYGFKRYGKNKFVIIAPHAAGDDLKTALVAAKLSKKINAGLIVNNKYFKISNSKAKNNPEYTEDFNRLSWSYKHHKYLWSKKKPAMKDFFLDIDLFCQQASIYSNEKKAIAIYIHGIKNKKTGIDIGVGLKSINGKNKFINSNKKINNNGGFITIKINQLKKLHHNLHQKLKKEYNLSASVGKKYIGWSKQSAIQFHKHEGRNDYSLQLEINRKLRNKKNIDRLIDILHDNLINTF